MTFNLTFLGAKPIEGYNPQEISKIEEELRNDGDFEGNDRFLSPNDRLIDLYKADSATLKRLNITSTQIGDYLNSLLERLGEICRQNFEYQNRDPRGCEEAGAILDGKICVKKLNYWMTFRGCPFPKMETNPSCLNHCMVLPADSYELTDLRTNTSIKINSKVIHLIRDHCFFGGNTPLRKSPEMLVQFLGLESGKDYKLDIIKKQFWSMLSGSSRVELEDFYDALTYAKSKHMLGSAVAFLLNYDRAYIYRDKHLTNLEKEIKNNRAANPSEKIDVENISKLLKGMGVDPDAKVWKDNGNKYLHIFNNKKEDEKLDKNIFEIAGAEISFRDGVIDPGLKVYWLTDGKFAALAPGDKLDEEKYQEWKEQEALWEKIVNITKPIFSKLFDIKAKEDAKEEVEILIEDFRKFRKEIFDRKSLTPDEKLKAIQKLTDEFSIRCKQFYS